ncbi:MAG: hypothetical protein OXU20_13815 [Myxococcales bacterium]|nr:hypothetical protein [Myxococcales bacterium]MDD9970444.1 hypothetical protein [Myxococcales bacterium]
MQPPIKKDAQQPWEKDVARARARRLEDLRAWRAMVLPLSAFANFLFFVSLEEAGSDTVSTVCALVAASVLTLWTVAIQAQIEGMNREE